jgi:HEAT repeats/Putative zinc-finger
MSCQQYEELFSLYLYGELNAAEEESLEAHCAACPHCHASLERERALHAAVDQSEPALPAMLVSSCRRELAGTLASGAEQQQHPDWGTRLQAWFGAAGWKPVAGLALVACGFFTGRVGQRPVAKNLPPDTVMTRVRDVAPDGEGGVRLVLEETRQRTIGGALDDERIKAMLMTAAQDPADAGLRFGSVDLLRRQTSALDVRQKLMEVMERDPNPGVRLKAMEGLRPFASDPAVRSLFARSLERDDNPGIRTQAVDLLIEHGQQDVVGVLQRLMQREDNGYIRSRSRRALEAINASVETF